MMISIWLLLSSIICRQAEADNIFLFWIIAGIPFGIRRMCIWLIPWNYGIAGSIGVLALNCIIGGMIGGVVLIFKIAGIAAEIIRILTGTYSTA